MKQWLPRVCESLVVNYIKDPIIDSSTKYQIGGQPGKRSQFHLFVLKSVIGLREVSDSGAVITSVDIEKFFDRESLSDTILTLHRTPGVDHKAEIVVETE